MGFQTLNGAFSSLASGVTNSATSLTVATGDGAKFGSPTTTNPVRCVVVDTSTTPETIKEYVDVTGVSTDTLTIVRGREGTSGVALTAGWYIAAVQTAQTLATILATDQSGTTYTTVLADAGTVVRLTNASLATVTIPPNSSVAYPIGTILNLYAAGAGGVTLVAGAGVTIRNNVGSLPQYGEWSLRKDGTDEWVRTP